MLAALDEAELLDGGELTGERLARQRRAAREWLDQYAVPIVEGARVRDDDVRTARGKQMFDRIRAANADVDAAVRNRQQAENAAAARTEQVVQLVCAGLVIGVLLTGFDLARTGRRQLLEPLANLRRSLERRVAGDRTASVVPAGAVELRTVIEILNDLTERADELLAAEQARAARAGLRQAVAVELRELAQPQEATDPARTGRRIATLIGEALGADAVRSRLTVPPAGDLDIRWPDGTAGLDDACEHELLAAAPGAVRVGGGLAVTFGGDDHCPPGYLHLTRPARDWTEPEQRLLTGVVQEIDRALRQLSLHRHQARLISELRRLDHRKDVFIQTVTHELRTPLTSILGYTEVLVEDEERLDPMQRRALTAILRNAHRLHQTMGDLLLLDRTEGGIALDAAPLDLAEVATDVHRQLGAAAQAKELTVTFHAASAWVRGDRTQLARALRKLMENAIKFTPPGGSVRCRLSADEKTVTVAVTDTGIGIPAEDVPGLFTPFHRAGNAMDQAVQGPGLGLAIVRDIVRDHGGSVAVQSVVGRGSTFTLTLPAVAAPAFEPVPVS